MPLPPSSPPLTRAESSNYQHTSLHRDVLDYIEALRARGDNRLHVEDFGSSPEGRLLPLLVLSAQGIRSPRRRARAGLPVVLVMNGIHAGEVEGKEASLMLVRDMLDGHHGDLLQQLVLVVVPCSTPTATTASRRTTAGSKSKSSAGSWARLRRRHARQRGRRSTSTATTCASRRGDAPAAAARRAALGRAPDHRLPRHQRLHPPLRAHLRHPAHVASGRARADRVHARTAVAGGARRGQAIGASTPSTTATSCATRRPGHGWITYTHHPRFGGNYRGLTNRLDLLLETYSYIPFDERVHATYAFLRETLRHVAANGREIVALLDACRMPPPQWRCATGSRPSPT
jgi:hypothetical protein